MSSDKDAMVEELKALTTETLSMLTIYVEIAGWSRTVAMMERIAETRQEGRIAGVLMAVQRFLAAEEG